MQKNWRKRLQYTLTDWKMYVASGGFVAFTMMGAIAFGKYDIGFGGDVLAGVSLLFFGHFIGQVLFADTHEYDKKIQEKEFGKEFLDRVEQVKKEQVEQEAKKKQMEHLIALLKESVPLDEEMRNRVGEITKVIREIVETKTIAIEEEHYLTYRLPIDITKMLRLYKELNKERQQCKEQEIFSFLERVQEELQERFIERYQKETMQALDTQLVISKQRMYERE